MMKTKITTILLIAGLGFGALGVRCTAAQTLGETNQYAVDLINWIRLDPEAYAVGLGYDKDQLSLALPWLKGMISDGLPGVSVTEALNAQAVEQNLPEGGVAATDAVPASVPAISCPVSGVVSFLNFMEPQKAVRVVVNYQFKQELDANYFGPRVILNPEVDRVGVDIQTGKKAYEQITYNAYFISIVMASSLSGSQRQLLNLINQGRKYPLRVGRKWAGITDWLAWDPDTSFPPLFFSASLQPFADAAVLTGDWRGAFDCAGQSCLFRSSVEFFPKSDLEDVVSWMYSSLALSEIKGVSGSDSVVFNAGLSRAGVGFLVVPGEAYDQARAVLVAAPSPTSAEDVGVSGDKATATVYGLVYADANENGVYDPGEGVPQRGVLIFDRAGLIAQSLVVTDATGHFRISLPRGDQYLVQTDYEDQSYYGELRLQDDSFLSIPVGN